jgi:SAM-dependent methyltransferase
MTRPPELVLDYGLAAEDYHAHRQGFPNEFFSRLKPLGVGLAKQRLLDLGTGTGLLARDFARRGCLVTGVDVCAPMLALAEAANAGEVVRPLYLRHRAEATGLPNAAFDVVAAGTAWHLFNRRAAAREARRVLAAQGRLLIAHLDWHAVPGGVVAATLRLLERFAPADSEPASFVYPDWTEDLISAGFTGWEMFAFTTALRYTPAGWRGRVRASHRTAPVMTRPDLEALDAALARLLSRQFPGPVLEVPHRVFALVAR